MQTKGVQKFVTFSPELYALVSAKAGRFGMSVPEYLRVLALNDVKKDAEVLEMVDEDTERRIGEGLEDLKSGRYTTVKTKEDLEKYFDEIHKQI